MHQVHPAPAQETGQSAVGQAPTDMERLSRLVAAARSAGKKQSSAELCAVLPEELDALFDEAMLAYAAGDWADAGLIAIQFARHEPESERFLSLAQACLRRLS